MRIQPNKVIGIFIVAGAILLLLGTGANWFLSRNSHASQPSPTPTPIPTNNAITHENALPGTSDWQIPVNKAASIQIQAYASATSVASGQKLTFYVSAQKAGVRFNIDIYRLGWYGGSGGRLMTSITRQTGSAQGYYDTRLHRLVNCTTCRIDTRTGLVEANWRPSFVLMVPVAWVTGIYLAKFTDASGSQTYVPFVVTGNARSLYLAVSSVTTYEAYNDWGGYSLYEGYNDTATTETPTLDKAVKVSFDRPYTRGFGSGDLLLFELASIHWLERQGYDLSYMSSVDVHENPGSLLQHHVYLSIGHDEYWTKEMRDGVENARNHGVSLAFLGANAAYWQARLEPDSAGIADRTIVCYKVETAQHTLAEDPLYGVDNSRVTTQWRDPLIKRPENALIGIMYSSLTLIRQGFPWELNPVVHTSLLSSTGLQPGQRYGCDLIGYEWDRIFDNHATPPGLQILATSPTSEDSGVADVSNTTFYIASSGAMVFASGSVYWATALDTYRFPKNQPDPICGKQNQIIPGIQKLMANVMHALLVDSYK